MFVEIKGLYFKYNNAEQYNIKDFNLAIEKGEIICILGESGSGKSTVLRLIAGLEIPIKGTITANNQCLVNDNVFILPEKREMGMVFQDYALFPHMTVSENILFGLKNIRKKEKTKRLHEMLELVKMQDYKDRYPYELSGGQQQRVALARAVAPEPSLLLLDEPFSNLDEHLQSKIREELKDIIHKTGITSIFVTHNQQDARSIANRVVILNRGEIVQVGNPNEVLY